MQFNIDQLTLPNDRSLTKEELLMRTAALEQRAIKAEKRLESVELLVLYANDIVNLWPTITMRTLWKITDKVSSLKECLKQIK
ncbi:hypothetical protein UFOVP1290_465 [uncultured Caudovirales phage]|uniref:Coil containing protein n=1 Tax=uncultured Caudovirales phage TaxID=2100421 RepID=A0A6J5RXG9_9CAUD|nr:hypothetical protein UFOVP1290_465 [uncultured Caudovirales phage]